MGDVNLSGKMKLSKYAREKALQEMQAKKKTFWQRVKEFWKRIFN